MKDNTSEKASIMEEIRKEIAENGLKDDLPDMDSLASLDCDTSAIGSDNFFGMSMTQDISPFCEDSGSGIKKFIKRTIAKAVLFYFSSFSKSVSEFNGYTTRAVMDMNTELHKQKKQIELLTREIEELKKNTGKQ